jgi:hypothetical protein
MWHWQAQDIVGIRAAQREDHIAADGGCPVLAGSVNSETNRDRPLSMLRRTFDHEFVANSQYA